MIDKFNIPIDEYLRRCKAIIATWEESEKELLGDGSEIDVRPQSHEYGSYIIHSRETNTLRTVYGNIPNQGIISNLPEACCVEVPCQVDATGLSPVMIGDLPPQLAAMCMTNINVQDLTVQAALTGKREHIYHAAMMDPHTAASLPLDQIWSMCDDLIEAHQKEGLLGEYSPVIKNTGRSLTGMTNKTVLRIQDEGFQNKEGGVTTLKIISNTDHTFKGILRLKSDNEVIEFSESEIDLASFSGDYAVQLTAKSDINEPVKVQISTESEDIICVGLTLFPRKLIESKSGKDPKFSVELSGFESALGSFSYSEKELKLSLKVHDSNILEAEDRERPWDGSCVELFFTTNKKQNTYKKFFVQPSKDGEFTLSEGRNLAQPCSQVIAKNVRVTEMYYSCDVVLPLDYIEFDPANEKLLFNTFVKVNALGDAHSGGKSSLNGNLDPNQASGNYYQVNF